MKKCPYCAEEIQEEAIVCRYCGRDLIVKSGLTQSEEYTGLTLLELLEIFKICGYHRAFELEKNLVHDLSEIIDTVQKETIYELFARHIKLGLITYTQVKSKLYDENMVAMGWGYSCFTLGIACGYNYLDFAYASRYPFRFSQPYAIHISDYIYLLVTRGYETQEKGNLETNTLWKKIAKAALNLEELGRNNYKSASVTHSEKLSAFAKAVMNLPEYSL